MAPARSICSTTSELSLYPCAAHHQSTRRPDMRLISTLVAIVLTVACAVRPYSVTIRVPADTLLPPSHELDSYTSSSGLSLQLQRSTAYCGQTKQAIAREIDQRDRRALARRSTLLLIGSAAALASTMYSGVQDQPDKRIVVPLSAISGTTLLTALPSLGKDERADALREKLTAVKAKEAAAIEIW